ncbi:outer membrane beta-barrel protein [Winogradskyella sp. PE311]|uniref:outer membrane beta-barrel protein n=1 Tax=Winogradskyella sp. PE311 TaxID=3366943 RepID=UPI00397E9A46
MKKLFLAAFAVFAFASINAQEGFSAKAGFNSVSISVSGASGSESGFYLGLGYQFELSEEFDIEPAILYSSVSDLNSLYIPVMVKYGISEDFSLMAGPQVNYLLEDVEQGEFGIDLGAGLSYNISEDFYAEARYAFQVSRDIEADINTLTVGVGYRF